MVGSEHKLKDGCERRVGDRPKRLRQDRVWGQKIKRHERLFSRQLEGQLPDVGNQLCQKMQSGGRKNESRLLKFTLVQGG